MQKNIFILTLIVVLFILISCTSVQKSEFPEYESKYFKYAVETKQDGTKIGYLTGFTEIGKTQTALVLPSEIAGIPIVGIGYRRYLPLFGTEVISDFESDQLEKLFIPFEKTETESWRWDFDFGTLPNCFIVTWTESSLVRIGLIKGYIHSFQEYQQNPSSPTMDQLNIRKIANVTYLYNYQGAPHQGYYWIDSYNKSNISFIPDDPIREGYQFDGWYKDVGCIDPWDFDLDQTGEEIIVNAQGIQNYTGITLYAKWIPTSI